MIIFVSSGEDQASREKKIRLTQVIKLHTHTEYLHLT